MNKSDGLNQIPHLAPEKGFQKGSYAKTIGTRLAVTLATFVTISVFVILMLRWINPSTSSFMQQRQYTAWGEQEPLELRHEWTNWEQISPHIKMAVITSEDQSFATHWGLDLSSIQKAIDEYERGQDLRGASTITQQVAKNLFLWPGQSFIRKGVEAYLALVIELLWPKQRILEVYLNIIEFGDGIYGVQAAAERFFNTDAARLSKYQSALMVTALPAPKRYNLDRPSPYMFDRRNWVIRYMDLLGNSHYLQRLK